MFDDPGHYIQLIAALVLAIGVFMGAYVASEKVILALLVLLVPFQIINSQYGSLNVGLVYAVAVVFLLRGRINRLPLIGIVGLILFVYLLSIAQVPKGAFRDNAIYLFSIGSSFVLFYIVFNSINRMGEEGREFYWKILLALNVLILGYCGLQLAGGLTGQISLGLEELSLNEVRGREQRLTGPFKATALTAEYFDIQMLILLYTLQHEGRRFRKYILWTLFALNSGFLVATGNRGGIVTLVAGMLLYLYMFRKELGPQLVLKMSLAATLFFALMAAVVVKYTDFNVLFDRLSETEIDGVIPDTRQGWIYMLPKILEKPVIGHGPRLRLNENTYKNNRGIYHMSYPHNGYLYLVYSIGMVGLLAYLVFFGALGLHFAKSSRLRTDTPFNDGLPKLGLIILFMIALSQMRMEMFRFITLDYHQFVWMLMGGLLALTQRQRSGYQASSVHASTGLNNNGGRILRHKLVK